VQAVVQLQVPLHQARATAAVKQGGQEALVTHVRRVRTRVQQVVLAASSARLVHGLWSMVLLHPLSVIVILDTREHGQHAVCVQRERRGTQVPRLQYRPVVLVVLELLPPQAPVISKIVLVTLATPVQTICHVLRVRLESIRASLALQRARIVL